ncbi:MAG: hypothetical protein PHT30_01755 [Bacilli bacterium]|nr:hypothetical protein [Bacilli bacterium]
MNKIREAAQKYFEEELSGDPLCQDSVVDWLVEFAERQIKAAKDDYTLVTDANNEPKEFINDNRYSYEI